MLKLLSKLFKRRKILDKNLKSQTKRILELSQEYRNLSDSDIKIKTNILKEQVKTEEDLVRILPEAYALVREAARRTIGEEHYEVQLIGGIYLHYGKVIEMRTGEGKTLVATLPAYLNSLLGKGVHIVTSNDYLVKRDALWMKPLYDMLGVTSGYVVSGIDDYSRKLAYNADITYCTNNELGFDYLRDNMKNNYNELVMRGLHFAIIDEADSILIDESRTPLIISGINELSVDYYLDSNKIVGQLLENHYEIDEKSRSVFLTDEGVDYIENYLSNNAKYNDNNNLYDPENIHILHAIMQSLKAHKLFRKDGDYIVKQNKILIIDEFTGRIAQGRRYSDGLHQALEAKENVAILPENRTLASVTFQNYFRLYSKLAGMSGTALTEAEEFSTIYGLDVSEIPTNLKIARIDYDDDIYKTENAKNNAIIKLISEAHMKGQPILVGTPTIEKSELISELLKKENIKHKVLNAKYHEMEASIIAQAGRSGSVTIATNMAGRGTDIKLGGNAELLAKEMMNKNATTEEYEKILTEVKEVVAKDKEKVKTLGGLLIIGTERNESRRIDNQLRGRAGRQGDPGVTKFFISLEDSLMRIFGSEKLIGLLNRLGMKEDEVINHRLITRSIEKAQTRIEMRNFDIRKTLFKFDNIVNDQRAVVYARRLQIMKLSDPEIISLDIHNEFLDLIKEKLEQFLKQDISEELITLINESYNLNIDPNDPKLYDKFGQNELIDLIDQSYKLILEKNKKAFGHKSWSELQNSVLLGSLDKLWQDYLLNLDHLRNSVNLRAYGQKDPFNEYKYDSYILFINMMQEYRKQVVSFFTHLKLEEQKQVPDPVINIDDINNKDYFALNRNDKCFCNSGKKYKHCHGKILV